MLFGLLLSVSLLSSSFCQLSLSSTKISLDLSVKTFYNFQSNFNKFMSDSIVSDRNTDKIILDMFIDSYNLVLTQKLYQFNTDSLFKFLSFPEIKVKDFVYALNYFGQIYFRDNELTKKIINSLEMGEFSYYSREYQKDFLDIFKEANSYKDQRFKSLITNVKNHLYRPEESIAYMYKVWKLIVEAIPLEKKNNIKSLLNYVGLNLNKLVVMYPNLGQLKPETRMFEVGAHRGSLYYTLGGFQYKGYAKRFIKNQKTFKDNLIFTGSLEERSLNLNLIDNKKNNSFKSLSKYQAKSLRKNIISILSLNLSTRIKYSSKFKVYVKFLENTDKVIPLTSTVVFDKPVNDRNLRLVWIHSDPDYISSILSFAQVELDKLCAYKNPTYKQKIESIASIHYLLVESLPFMRGSALGADIISKILSLQYGVNLYKWNYGVFPDLEALTSPNIDFYKKRYSSFFDISNN